MLGKNEFEEARCNMVLECTHDMLVPLVDIFLRDEETRVRNANMTRPCACVCVCVCVRA